MRKIIILTFVMLLLFTFSLFAQNWLKLVLSGGAINSGTMGSCVVALPNGDIVIGGQYKADELQFGNITLKSIIPAKKLISLDIHKAYIAKISKGEYIWAKTIGSKGDDDNLILSIKVDTNGNFFILGSASNPITIGNVNINKTTKKAYAYIAKFNEDGECLWAKAIDHYNTPSDISFDVNNSGEIVVATTVLQTDRKIQQDKIVYNRPGSYSSAVLIRFSNAGECLWIRGGVSEGAGSASTAKAVVIDSDGNVYITGDYMAGSNVSGKLTFNEQSVMFPTTVQKTPACGGVFIAKYGKDGACQFVNNCGSNITSANQKPKTLGLELDESLKSVFVLGRFTKDFVVWDNAGTMKLEEVTNTGQSSYFIGKFSIDGTFQQLVWSETKNCWVEIAGLKKCGNKFLLMGNFAGNLEPAAGKKFVSTQNRSVSRQKYFPFIISMNEKLEFEDCKVPEANAETKISGVCIGVNGIVCIGTYSDDVTTANMAGLDIELPKGFSKAFVWSLLEK